jgi:hypothetical protein
MKRKLIATVLGALALLLAAGAGKAVAASPGVQTVSQGAGSAQQATAASGATQIAPSNTNISVRVLSPGDDGAVSQTNSTSSDADATNSNSTTQGVDQDQSGGGIQTADQTALNEQAAGALSTAYQAGASNQNIPVRVLSPGSNGSVTQSNTAGSNADSTNTNTTDQSTDQTQGGSSCGCSSTPATVAPDQSADVAPATSDGSGANVQSADQSSGNAQLAGAASSATQVDPKNTNIDVRVLSPGNNGSVSQSNSAKSDADASNHNSTSQTATQDPTGGSSSCGCGGPTDIQTAKQTAGNLQIAGAASTATQIGAKNVNTPVRVLSPGNDGSVDQSNKVDSNADASNSNHTNQMSDQDQSGSGGCGCSSDPIQVTQQSSGSLQGAFALSAADQLGAENENSPVRVGSSGNGGSVDQSNTDKSDASATNRNSTDQTADQDQSSSSSPCGCGDGVGIQALGQSSVNGQAALSASGAFQDFGKSDCGCSSGGNSNDPVRVWSPGNDGSVDQSNKADSKADSTNHNSTSQDADQSQSGSGIDIQALGQESENGQFAGALSGAFQLDPSNKNDGARVYSPGYGGSVDQSNRASSKADADNSNHTTQDASQSQAGSGGCGCGGSDPQIQALGQYAGNLQTGFGLSTALQLAPKNSNGGTAVWSPGKNGMTRQSNKASSNGDADNRNGLSQLAMQMQ